MIYFKELLNLEDFEIRLGKEMDYTVKQLSFDESQEFAKDELAPLNPGITLYAGDKILVRLFDENCVASWYLMEIDCY